MNRKTTQAYKLIRIHPNFAFTAVDLQRELDLDEDQLTIVWKELLELSKLPDVLLRFVPRDQPRFEWKIKDN